jgi:hypothetical protein
MIYITHGIVESLQQQKFCHMDFLDRELFINHLANKKEKYVSLQEALEEKGDALTIDDSLIGGVEAAALCREFGHEVSLFINPFYIQNQFLYWFCIINIFLDSDKTEKILWKNKEYFLSDFHSKLKFRINLKNTIAPLSAKKSKSNIELIFKQSINKDSVIPSHLVILSINELKKASSLGIEIHNHGWTHRQIIAFNDSELDQEILKAKEWLDAVLGINTDFYAVPFGKDLPPNRYSFNNCSMWFLAYDKLNYGQIGPQVYNRKPLILR